MAGVINVLTGLKVMPVQNVAANLKRSFTQKMKYSTKIGFVGLGNMGKGMAKNLQKKGYNLVIYDINPGAMSEFEKSGALVCSSPSEVAKHAEKVITMLPANKHVEETYKGKGGIFESLKKNTLLIDSSTVDPDLTKSLAAISKEKGGIFMDAPVSGGINAAASGQLTFMVGAEENVFPEVKELLQHMGSRVVHCGPVGSGQAAKLCNNMLLGVSMIATAEAMNLGMRLGLQPKKLMDIINASSGRCWSSEVYNPVPGTIDNVPSANNYQHGFATKLMAKDLGLAQEAAYKTSTPVLLGSVAHQLYLTLMTRGFSEKDFSVIYQFLREESKNV